MKIRAYQEVERHLLNHAKALHQSTLTKIGRRAIALRLAEIELTSGPVARNRVRSSLSALIGGLRWSEVGFKRDLIALPPARTKNKRLHELPLSPRARAILERQPRRKNTDNTTRDLIFGYGEGGFSGWSDCKARLDENLLAVRKRTDKRAKPLPQWRLHDLRRTVATVMADKLGVLPHVVEAILNHVNGHRARVGRSLQSGEIRG